MTEQKYVRKARSKKNGMIFYSNSLPFIAVETILDDSGEIHSQIVPSRIYDFFEYLGVINENKKDTTKWKVIIFDVLLIILGIISKNFYVFLGALYFSATASYELFDFIEIAYQFKSKKGTEFSTSRFHAAEHMVIDAYERLQRIPTLEEAKKESRFSKECGSMRILNKLCTLILISLDIIFIGSWNSIAYFISLFFILIFAIISNKKGWLRFLQVFITNKPTDTELNLAIEAIKNFESMEEEIKNKLSNQENTIISFRIDHL